MLRLRTTKTALYLGLSLLFLISSCKKDPVADPNPNPGGGPFAVDIGDSEIPYLQIDTKGEQILNEPKIPAELRVYIDKSEVISTNIGIEYRGSTSFRISDKKSFGIETWDADGEDASLSFFGFPEEEDWILNGHIVNLTDRFIFDRTLMYHYFGYQLFRDMGRYASRSKFVELEINGEYQGVYVFMEKLKRDKNRIDIKSLKSDDEDPDEITGGYILKIDKTTGGDLNIDQPLEYFETNWEDDARYKPEISFRSQYDINGQAIDFEPYGPPYHPKQYLETYFLYEYPDAEDMTDLQKTYIQHYIHDFETALLTDDFTTDTRTYLDYIDLNSFVDFFIINEVCRNVDGYRLSTFMYKDRGEKLKMGPIWDLNIGYDTGDRIPWDDWVINYNNYVSSDAWMMPFWWPRLMEDPIFRQALKERWNELRAGALSTTKLLELADQTATYLKANGAITRNYQKWDIGTPVDYDGAVNSLKNFLQTRTQWMDAEIGSF
jgi:spore coat protein CotH